MRISIVLVSLFFAVSCSSRQSGDPVIVPASEPAVTEAPAPAPASIPAVEPAIDAPTPAADSFEPVKAMLGTACAPCHNPGGKMYASLPFDNPEVIRSHGSGIVGRLKDDNKLLLENWLKTQQSPNPDSIP